MTVSDVAKHVKLDWKTVKNIDKIHLEAKYGQPDYNNLKIIEAVAMDMWDPFINAVKKK